MEVYNTSWDAVNQFSGEDSGAADNPQFYLRIHQKGNYFHAVALNLEVMDSQARAKIARRDKVDMSRSRANE